MGSLRLAGGVEPRVLTIAERARFQRGRISHAAVAFTFLVAAFMADANFRRRDIASYDVVDWEVYLMLGVWALAGALVMLYWRDALRGLNSLGGASMLVLLAVSVPLSLLAPEPVYSVAVAGTNIVALLLAVVTAQVLGESQTRKMIVLAGVAYLGVSLAVYLILPDFGHHRHEVRTLAVPFDRIAGLSHPNKIGWISGLVLLGLLSAAPDSARRMPFWILAACLASVTAVLAFSRTAVIGLLCAPVLAKAIRRPLSWGLIAGIAVVGGALFLVVTGPSIVYDALSLVSRTGGDEAQIATLTGRVLIWEATSRFIVERPLLGHGIGASRALLVDHFAGAGFVPDQAHNLYLNVLVNAGLIGLGLFGIVLAHILVRLRSRADRFWLRATCYVLITGATEAHLMDGPPTFTSLVLWSALGLTVVQARSAEAVG